MPEEKQIRKKKLNGVDAKRIIEALLLTNGILNKACKLINVDRGTLSKYLREHPKVNEEFKDTVIGSRSDDCKSNLILMANGNIIAEKTKYDKHGNPVLVYYRREPHFSANMKLLEMAGEYTPKQAIDHTVKPFDLDLAGKKMKGYGDE